MKLKDALRPWRWKEKRIGHALRLSGNSCGAASGGDL